METEITAKISRDKNGNKIVKVSAPNKRTFSIQTNGNLPYCHQLGFGDILKSSEKTSQHGLRQIASYVFEFGTDNQREALGLQNTAKQPITAII